ncbi:hypothetical protein PHYSODRAFT_301680 [Phytophthora sojae]|uniref:Uncharacterized protein n=1 Tax=Phytophthora sojae (strain P6497) TaxID=1094619 RepID=G4ZKZ4_PHYSP|nr:hypothetical protein PHYSODRAFT_301680 [Phytophthora sojae]EGZ14912.1 hypothetical protein PHYSODRAFT_301680 [Phytophthora sojae]|eukprot:XP_009528661.1 hypothetical protein PHYSODRAFT_301680 [Phytophthora sojae]
MLKQAEEALAARMKCEVVAALCGAPIGSLHYRLKRDRDRTTVFPNESKVSNSNGDDELEYIPNLSAEEHSKEDEKGLIVSPPSEVNISFTGGRTTGEEGARTTPRT